NIKKIIRLDQTSDEHEIFSVEFVSFVLKVLNGLKENEKNLITRRTFIMRCMDIIPLELPVLQRLYQEIFSHEHFPLIGSIISRIFLKEENENENTFFTLFTNTQRILDLSSRLHIISTCLKIKNANSPMAALCCDIIQQNYFSSLEMAEIIEYFKPIAKTLIVTRVEPLQQISAIAFLKEFVGLIMTCLYMFRASCEWGPNETRVAEFSRTIFTMNSLPTIYRQTVDKMLLNRHPLLFITSKIDNETLMMKSVIAHAIALHISMSPDALLLATLLHKLDTCQNKYILVCISDVDSVVLNIVIVNGGQIAR
ncbi:9401_t:CDS:2, partial [Acaulospora colombiana]